MKEVSREDLQKVAGIIDGEGSITIAKVKYNNKYGYYFHAQITISNTDIRLLEYVLSILGVGKIRRLPVKGNRNPIYSFDVRHSDAIDISKTIHEFSIIKKEQYAIMLEFAKTFEVNYSGGKHGGDLPDYIQKRREELYFRIKALHGGHIRNTEVVNQTPDVKQTKTIFDFGESSC